MKHSVFTVSYPRHFRSFLLMFPADKNNLSAGKSVNRFTELYLIYKTGFGNLIIGFRIANPIYLRLKYICRDCFFLNNTNQLYIFITL